MNLPRIGLAQWLTAVSLLGLSFPAYSSAQDYYKVQDVAILQYLYFLPPATDKEIVRTLRKSFFDTLKDPDFLAEMDKANLAVAPVGGEVIDGMVSGLFKLDAPMVAKLKGVLVP